MPMYALTRGLAWHCEEGGDAQGGPPGHRVHVHPEADPGDDDDQNGGDVGLDHVEPQGSLQVELCQ